MWLSGSPGAVSVVIERNLLFGKSIHVPLRDVFSTFFFNVRPEGVDDWGDHSINKGCRSLSLSL